jgi:hypothetical protein
MGCRAINDDDDDDNYDHFELPETSFQWEQVIIEVVTVFL